MSISKYNKVRLSSFLSCMKGLMGFRVLFVCVTIGLLSYCTSCNKSASSFATRKYTKGRFIDRVAKLKMQYLPSKNVDSKQWAVGSSQSSAKMTHESSSHTNDSYSPSTIPSQDTISSNSAQESGTSSLLKQILTPPADAPISTNINSSTKETSYPYSGQDERYARNNQKANTLLAAWIVCLVLTIALTFALIGDSFNAGTGANANATESAGCVLALLWLFTFVGAIVFFILWIVALAS